MSDLALPLAVPHRRWLGGLAVAACLALAAWVVLVPLAGLLVTAFSEDTGTGPGTWSLANFAEVFHDEHLGLLLRNSAVYAVGSALLAGVLGLFLAAVVEKTDTPCRGAMHVGALLALAIPGLLTTMAWMLALSPNVGWVNLLLRRGLGLGAAPFDIYSMSGMVWALGSHDFPLAYLVLAPAMRALDSRMEEAASVAGARNWQVALRVTLPVLRPAILSALLLLFVGGLASFEVPRLIGVPAHIGVLTTAILDATNDTPPAFGTAGALGMVLLAVSVVAVLLYRRATSRAGAFATVGGKGSEARRLALGAWRWPVAALALLLFVAALGLPLLTLAWQSFFARPSLPFLPPSGPAGWGNYGFVLRYPIFLGAVATSVRVAAMAATLVVLLGLFLAWLAQRASPWSRAAIDLLAFTPIAIPSVIVGASVLFAYLLLPIPVYNTAWILLIAYLALFMPYGMRFAAAGLAQLHRELEEAAEIAGAGTLQVFRRILLPALAPVLVSAWLYVFVLAARELGASIFLVGPDSQVLSTITLTMWEEGSSYGAVCALSMIQIVPLLAIVLLLRVAERLVGGGAVRAGLR